MAILERLVTLKSPSQIERMAVAGALVAEVLDAVGQHIDPCRAVATAAASNH